MAQERKATLLADRFIKNDLFTLPDSDSDSDLDSDSKPNGYIALCRSFHTAQSQIQIPILTVNYRNGIRIRVHTTSPVSRNVNDLLMNLT